MPKKSKVKVPNAKAKEEKAKRAERRASVEASIVQQPTFEIKCTMCGRLGTTNENNGSFYKSHSILHKGVGGYVPICKQCLEDLWIAYKKSFQSEVEATRRLCMKIDAYWNENTYKSAREKRLEQGHIMKFGEYLKLLHLANFKGKTYDTTLAEEAPIKTPVFENKDADEPIDIKVTMDQVRVWGAGFDPLFYRELDQKYDYWTEDIDVDEMDKATESLIRQICIQEVILARDAAAGKPVDKTAKVIDSLLGSLNLKPVQKQKPLNGDGLDSINDKNPFGLWIRRIEDDRPIPEPSEEFADVDHLKDYLQTWFVGSLCNMMHIPNKFSDKFEEAMMEYTVEKPEYEMDDEDTSLDDLFEQAEKAGRQVSMEVDIDGGGEYGSPE